MVSDNTTRRPLLVWGPGLSPVLRSLPSLVLPPASSFALATGLTSFGVLRIHRGALAVGFWVFYKALNSIMVAARRRRDRTRLGPDVVEVPKANMKWPWNADFALLVAEAHENGYVNDVCVPFINSLGNTFNFAIFGDDYIFTTEPAHIKSILSTDFGSYQKDQRNRDKLSSVLGSGIFNSDGEMWKFHRTMSRPYFSRERVTHFDNFARHADVAISKIPDEATAINFQDLVSRFTMDSATEFLFGVDVKSLDEPLAAAETTNTSASFAKAFMRVQEKVLRRFMLANAWPYFEMFWDRTGEEMRVIDGYVEPILRTKLEKKGRGELSGEGEGETLLDYLVQHTDDEKVIKDELINVLVAGRDTTACTLTFLCYTLADNPAVFAKLRAEILNTVGSSAYLTSDNIREMKYMRAVINEVLRLFPPVPLNSRESVKATVLQSEGRKYFVPAGASCMFAVQLMHVRKDLWGPDADEFDPERWLDERYKKYVLPNPFIFLPFSAGPRICLGQQFTYNEISFFITRLLQRVTTITLAPEAHPAGTLPPPSWADCPGRKGIEKIWPKAHLTLYSTGGMWVRMKME
ncbi:hypothetical protein FRC08_002337 [Ceratobasidium sp. 394]|nr:hypothetical protein FRC08_002337 [Ceratobasidium sp. 394]